MVIYNSKKDKKTYKRALKAVLPVAKKYLKSVKFYFCPSDKTEDMMNAFGLGEDDLPRLVIHDTQSDEKFIQPAEEFSTKREDIENFLKSPSTWRARNICINRFSIIYLSTKMNNCSKISQHLRRRSILSSPSSSKHSRGN